MQLDKETTHLVELDGKTIEHVVTGITSNGNRFIDIILTNGTIATLIMEIEQ